MRLANTLLVILFACKPSEDDTGDPPIDDTFRFAAALPTTRSVWDGADQVVAIAHRRGSAVALTDARFASIAADGTFTLTLDAKSDWTLFLVDSTATDPRERVVAPVGLGLDAATLVSIAGGAVIGDIDAGTLVEVDATVRSDTTTDDVAGWFTFDEATLDALGIADDVLVGLSNVAANTAEGREDRYATRLGWAWEGSLETAHLAPAGPPYRYRGFGLDLVARGGPIDVAAIEAGTQQVVLRPPAAVVLGGGAFGPDAPMSPRWVFAKPEEGVSVLQFTDLPGNTTDIEPFSDVPPGWWSLEVDGVEVAAFELSFAIPRDAEGLPIGLYPTLSMATPVGPDPVGGTLAWHLRNAVTGVDSIVAADALTAIVGESAATASAFTPAGGLESETLAPTPGTLVTAFDVPADWWTSQAGPLSHGAPWFNGVWGWVAVGDVTTSVTWVDACPDHDGDTQAVCVEGSEADQDAMVWPGAPELCGDGKDNGLEGDADVACRARVEWRGGDVVPLARVAGGPNSTWGAIDVQVTDAAWADTDLALKLVGLTDSQLCGIGPGDGAPLDVVLGSTGLYGDSYLPLFLQESNCDPYVAPPEGSAVVVSVEVGPAGSTAPRDRFRFDLPVVTATADPGNLVAGASVSTATPAVGELIELQVWGTATTSGLFWLTPLSGPDGGVYGLEFTGSRLELRDAGTGDPITGICLTRDCALTADETVERRLAVYLPETRTIDWTAKLWVEWSVAGATPPQISPIVWTEDALGHPRYTSPDATWRALPTLPAATP